MAPNPITLSHLPYEIRQKIFIYLITIPWPIRFDGSFKAAYGHDNREIDKILTVVDVFPSDPSIFYTHNTFDLCSTLIPSFLAYTLSSPILGSITTPQKHITHLSTMILPLLYVKDDFSKSLRLLLSCPRLRKVDVEICAFYKGLCEFDVTFHKVREVFWELGKKLGGDDGLGVELRWLYGRARWTMEDFEREEPPA